MTILIIGAAGMIGRKIASALAGEALILADAVAPAPQANASCLTLDLTAPDTPARLIASRPAVIHHLAAVVSGEAEADFDKGYAVNLDATRALLEAIRAVPNYHPRVVYASSAAVFGRPFPDRIPDEFHALPLTSYGTQKLMIELLINDYSRRGIIDGISLRINRRNSQCDGRKKSIRIGAAAMRRHYRCRRAGASAVRAITGDAITGRTRRAWQFAL